MLAAVMAQAVDPASSPWVGNVVTPVILLGLIIGRVLVTGRELKRAEEQIAERDRQLAELHQVMTTQVIPALTLATEALKDSAAETAIRRRQP
jgi:hypothetical protein